MLFSGVLNTAMMNTDTLIVEDGILRSSEISSLDDDFKDEWSNNHTEWDFKAYPVGENIWYAGDDTFEFYGYEEVVESDGDYYMVSIKYIYRN